MKMGNKRKISAVSTLHFLRLVYRSALFIMLLITYIRSRMFNDATVVESVEKLPAILYICWAVFVIEMILRFFPSKYESPGCQKQFARNYIKTGNTDLLIPDNNATVLIALVWIVFNGIFGALYMEGILDDGIMILLCSVYSVCDIVCILFFCPFQTFILKNRCCTDCRIYNWDYAMMFTPFLFLPHLYTWSLLGMSLILLARWEITYHLHPERFSIWTNAGMSCRTCKEKLCHHKKQLQGFWKKNKELIRRF